MPSARRPLARLSVERLEDRLTPAGGLDPIFSGDGRLAIDIGPNPGPITINAMVVQPDGKAVLAGGTGTALAIQRINTDGSLDVTFSNGSTDLVWDGGDGIASFAPNSGGGLGLSAVALQADGKIVAVGAGATLGPQVWRLNADGTRDLTWGTASLRALPTVTGGFAGTGITVQADGKIVVVGYTTTNAGTGNDFVAIRLNLDGTPDTTFDGDGIQTIAIGAANAADRANAVALQADGKIVLAGQSASRFAAVRLNSDGSLDTTFSGDGLFTVVVSTAGDLAKAVAIQADGKIVLAGGTVVGIPLTYDFAAVRLNADGTLDTTFSGDGIAGPIAGTGTATAVAITADGKIVLAGDGIGGGSGGLYNAFGVAVLNANGTPDTNFSGDGVFNFEPSSVLVASGYQRAIGVAVTPSGKLVVGGNSFGTASVKNATLVRLNADGTFDTTLDGDGIALHPYRVLGSDSGYAAALQTDGKIVVAGSSSHSLATNADFALARVNPDGTLDNTFGNNGVLTTNLAGQDTAYAVAVQPDGKIVAAGGSNQSTPSLDTTAGVARYNANGTLDPSFGSGGILNLNLASSGDVFRAITFQPDGKIVLGGSIRTGAGSDYDFAVVRLNADGSYDTSFGVGGLFRLSIGTTDQVFSVAIRPDGKILASGSSDNRGAVVRLNANGSLDTSFDGDGIAIFGGTGLNQLRGFVEMALQADGKLVFTGNTLTQQPGSTVAHIGVARLNEDGSVDTSFSGDGVAPVVIGTGSSAASIAVAQDGRILVGGRAGGGQDYAVARLLSGGTLDPSFGTNGKVTVDMAGAPYGYVDPTTFDDLAALLIQPDGNIVLVGSIGTNPGPGSGGSDFGVARLDGGGVPPIDIRLSNGLIPENAGANALVGTLTTVDPNALDTHTYALVAGAGDTDNAQFTIVGDQLRAVASFDYESGPHTRTVRVRTTDQTGFSYEEAFTITITDVNELIARPDAVATDDRTAVTGNVLANDESPDGGTLVVTNPDTFTTARGTLVLRADGWYTYAPNANAAGTDVFTYSMSDGRGGSASSTLSITITDATAPLVTEVRLFYGSGATQYVRLADLNGRTLPWLNVRRIAIVFSEAVRVDADDLALTGVNVPAYSFAGFSYDPATFAATWTLAAPISVDRLQLALDGDGAAGVRDAHGVLMGTDYVRAFAVLPGDDTGNGKLELSDLTQLRSKIGPAVPYDPFADIDGDGDVDAADYSAALAAYRRNDRLPPGLTLLRLNFLPRFFLR